MLGHIQGRTGVTVRQPILTLNLVRYLVHYPVHYLVHYLTHYLVHYTVHYLVHCLMHDLVHYLVHDLVRYLVHHLRHLWARLAQQPSSARKPSLALTPNSFNQHSHSGYERLTETARSSSSLEAPPVASEIHDKGNSPSSPHKHGLGFGI